MDPLENYSDVILELGCIKNIFIKKDGGSLYRDDFDRLHVKELFNDNIINIYFAMLQEKRDDLRCFNTFFCLKLKQNGYAAVKNWKICRNLFSVSSILIPVHFPGHWTLVKVDLKEKSIMFFNSLSGSDDGYLRLIRGFIGQKSQSEGLPFNENEWTLQTAQNIPKQFNAVDCGVFVCCYAKSLAFNVPFQFSQQDMDAKRRRITYEIVKGDFI